MKTMEAAAITLVATTLAAATLFLIAGCSLRRPAPRTDPGPEQQGSVNMQIAQELARAPEFPPMVMRVGGDREVTTQYDDGVYRSGSARITTPLPDGYPPPTPPGAIELKRYPLVRRAGITGSTTPDWGMNVGFFPLFSHIQRRNIAMTSPVELDYEGMNEEGADKPRAWTMSFPYRDAAMGPTGVDPSDERILIEDVPPMAVVAVGLQGPYKLALVNKALAELRGWLAGQSEWQAAGEPRALFYNGPEASAREKWSEIQIPVRRRSSLAHGN